MTPKAEIAKFLGTLSRNSELLEAAYHDGSILITDENETVVRSLHNARVLSTREEGHYGLTRMMREMFDQHTQRHQRFAINGNIGDEIDRMEKLLFELEESTNRGFQDETQRNLSDLCESLYDIKDLITRDILQFCQVMDTEFSNVRTLEEKMRHNDHYLARVKRLQTALERLNTDDLHERLGRRSMRTAGRVFRRAITGSIEEWSSRLLSISKVFEKFMFSFREIAEETRRIRAFARFLKDGGEGKLYQALDNFDRCPSLCRSTDNIEDTWVDIYSDEGRDAAALIALDLKPIESRKVVERKAGKRRDDRTHSVEDEQSLEESSLSVFLDLVDQSPETLSAAHWAKSREGLRIGSFLEQVLAWAESHRDCDRDVNYISTKNKAARLANIEFKDIEVCRAA